MTCCPNCGYILGPVEQPTLRAVRGPLTVTCDPPAIRISSQAITATETSTTSSTSLDDPMPSLHTGAGGASATMLTTTRQRLKTPDDPNRPYIVQVHNGLTGELICWGGPYSVRERDKIVKQFKTPKAAPV